MENKFTWHKVSDEEKERIRKESKNLLNEFASKLEKIKSYDSHFEDKEGTRKEGTGWETDEKFKEIMFANAPLVEDNSIVAEKGGWNK